MNDFHTTTTDHAYDELIDAGKSYTAHLKAITDKLSPSSSNSLRFQFSENTADVITQVKLTRDELPAFMQKDFNPMHANLDQMFRDIALNHAITNVIGRDTEAQADPEKHILASERLVKRYAYPVDVDQGDKNSIFYSEKALAFYIDKMKGIALASKDTDFVTLLDDFGKDNTVVTAKYATFIGTVKPLIDPSKNNL